MTAEDESLPALLRRTQQAAWQAGHAIRLIDDPIFTVLVAGPVDVGKTTLVRTLLSDGRPPGEPALAARPGFSTTVPVEYVYGPPTLWLGLGGSHLAPGRWLAARPDDPDLLRTPGLRRVRVATPASALRDWDVRLVDYPGTDAPGDPLSMMVEAARQPDTGVVYAVPSRGITDGDSYALETLRAAPVVVVGSLREAELTADQSSFYEIEVPWLTAGVALQIVVPRLARPGPEREGLRYCVDLLRSVNLPAGWRAGAVDACLRGRKRLREEYAGAFEQALSVRHREPLRTLAGLLQLADRGPAEVEVEAALSRAARRAGTEQDVPGLREIVEATARTAVDRYNVQAARAIPSASVRIAVDQVDPVQLGDSYRQVRTDLIAALGNIATDDALGLTNGDQEVLTDVVDAISADRLEVAVLGQFSAGKSTFINALLGAKVLPTGRGPKTAAVTRLVYGEKPGVDATWRDRVELTLLSPTHERDRIRVHVQELQALHEWLDTGDVSADDCAFQLFGPGTADDTTQLDGFRRLWRDLSRAGNLPEFAYVGGGQQPQLPDCPLPGRVVVRKFARAHPAWPGSLSISEALEQASEQNPAFTLRVDELFVAYPDPFLQHVAIIDTPGTDAPFPHHRAMAYRAVRDKPQCAVIYCFSGFKAATSPRKAAATPPPSAPSAANAAPTANAKRQNTRAS